MKRKTVILGFLLAVAMILSYMESVLPLSIGIPGVKLGLPNLVAVLLLYLYGGRDAFVVNLLRILLSGFLFGNFASMIYSLSGAVCSFFIMLLFRRLKIFSVVGVSIGGGVFHNIGQLLVAMFVVETYAPLFYLPYLLIAGTLTGFLIGAVSTRIMPYMERIVHNERL